MVRKFRLVHLMAVLFVVLVLAGLSAQTNPTAVHAQTSGVTPTLYCLGGCPTTPVSPTVSSAPSGTTSAAPSGSSGSSSSSSSSAPSGTTSIVPSTSTTNTTSTTPCTTQSFSSLLNNHGAQDHGHHHHHRDGFLSGFFQFFLLLIELLLQMIGGGGALPCTTTPSPTVSPAVSGQPSGAPLSAAPSTVTPSTTQPSTAVPTNGQPVTLQPDVNTNWAGYAISTTFPTNSSITADWVVATLSCASKDGSLSPWSGFGGWNGDPNIAQLGNDMQCNSGSPSYPAWSEAYPAQSVYYTDPLDAGDQMTAKVTYLGNGSFATIMTNKTKGWSHSVPMSFSSSYKPTSAEVIFEAMGQTDPRYVPKFATASFTNSIYSPDGKQQIPLASGPGLGLMDIGVKNSFTQIKTSAITGGNFSETWLRN